MTHYDVVVLGAGPGGYVAAIRAARLGLNTAVVESKYWGGVCLNVGCIPSKALLRNAELVHIFTKEAKTFGINGEATFDYGIAYDRSRKVAEGRVAGVHFLMKKNKITEIHGYGRFTDAHTLSVELNDGGTETVTFDNAIIATGSSTRLVPGTSLSANVVTYEEQILSRELPESIVIAGAGAIGMEFGYLLKNYGVDVTIVEFLPRALPNEDAEVSKEIEKQFKKLGVKVLTGTKVESIADKIDKTPAVFVVLIYVVVCTVGGLMLAMVQDRPLVSALAIAVMSAVFASVAAAAPLYGYYCCQRMPHCLIGIIPY